jgi:RimJ/RimL family protein N-acetyltransferase
MILRESGEAVGSAGFKGPPEEAGIVEIAYGVAPNYEGRGLATEAARALGAFALDVSQVTLVRAHTLPAANATTRVLAKCGFRHVGEVVDPDDGLVWRWELGRDDMEVSGGKTGSGRG